MTSDCMYRWHILLEEYGPEIMYIKDVDNAVASDIRRLDYNPNQNRHADDENSDEYSSEEKWNTFFVRYLITMTQSQVTNQMKTTDIIIAKYLQIT